MEFISRWTNINNIIKTRRDTPDYTQQQVSTTQTQKRELTRQEKIKHNWDILKSELKGRTGQELVDAAIKIYMKWSAECIKQSSLTKSRSQKLVSIIHSWIPSNEEMSADEAKKAMQS